MKVAPRQFACRYYHDDAWWGLNIVAHDWEDAEVRARKLGLQLDGEIGAIIPADIPCAGIAIRIRVAFRNLFG